MSIEHIVDCGSVHTEIRDYDGEPCCFFWLSDDTGRTSETIVIMNAGCCRNVAESLFERARELEAEDCLDSDGR